MKTKLIIMTAIAATLLYACSDRDEETRKNAIESVKKSNQENFKLKHSGIESRESDPSITSDTIRVRGLNDLSSEDPDTNINPDDSSEGGDPKGLPPRK